MNLQSLQNFLFFLQKALRLKGTENQTLELEELNVEEHVSCPELGEPELARPVLDWVKASVPPIAVLSPPDACQKCQNNNTYHGCVSDAEISK